MGKIKIPKLFWPQFIREIITFIIITIVLLLVAFVLITQEMEKQINQLGSAIVKSIANSGVEVLLNRNVSVIQSTIESLLEADAISYAYVFDRKGDIVSSTFTPVTPKEIYALKNAYKEDKKEGLNTLHIEVLTIPGKGKFYDISIPVLSGEVGVIHIGIDYNLVSKKVMRATLAQVGIIALIFIVGLILGIIIINRLSRPLLELTSYANKVAKRDFSGALDIKTENEVGDLAKSIDSMVKELRSVFDKMQQDVEATTEQMNYSFAIAEKLTGITDKKQAAQIILDEAVKRIQSTAGYIALLNTDSQKLEILASTGKDLHYNAMPTNLGIVSHVLKDNKPLACIDVEKDARYNSSVDPAKSLLYSPLIIEGKTLGILCISHDSIYNYNDLDLKLATAMAKQAATALYNAMNYHNQLLTQNVSNYLNRIIRLPKEESTDESAIDISLDTKKMAIGLLSCDLKNYERIAKNQKPEDLEKYLNEYFREFLIQIGKNGGTQDRFLAQMISAWFADLSSTEIPVEIAINTAIALQKCAHCFPTGYVKDNFKTSMSVTLGRSLVSNWQSDEKIKYTLPKETLIIANRLRAIAKGGQILVCESVYNNTKAKFNYKFWGKVSVPGLESSINSYEVVYHDDNPRI